MNYFWRCGGSKDSPFFANRNFSEKSSLQPTTTTGSWAWQPKFMSDDGEHWLVKTLIIATWQTPSQGISKGQERWPLKSCAREAYYLFSTHTQGRTVDRVPNQTRKWTAISSKTSVVVRAAIHSQLNKNLQTEPSSGLSPRKAICMKPWILTTTDTLLCSSDGANFGACHITNTCTAPPGPIILSQTGGGCNQTTFAFRELCGPGCAKVPKRQITETIVNYTLDRL